MKKIFKFPKLYSKYELDYQLCKSRELNEIEAIILAIIIDAKANDNNSKNLLEYLLSKMNIQKDKWSEFIARILNKLLKDELQIKNKKLENNWKLDELFIGDIEINEDIKFNINKDKYIGLGEIEISKQCKLIINIKNRSNYIEINKDSKIINLENLPAGLINYSKDINKFNHDIINSFIKEKYQNLILKNFSITNIEEYKSNSNLVWSLDKDYEFNLDFNNWKISFEQKELYELCEFMIEYNVLDQFTKTFEQEINSKINLKIDEISPNNWKYIEDIDQYNDLNKQVIENNAKLQKLVNLAIYQDELVLINKQITKFDFYNEQTKLNIYLLTYSNIENDKLLQILKESPNFNWIEILKKIKNNNQKYIIEKWIITNYEDLFNNEIYKQWIIDNFQNIDPINVKWLFSLDVKLIDFEKLLLKNNFKIIK